MKPETLKKLREYPEYRELVALLADELKKADSLDGIAALPFEDRGHEVTARSAMRERLVAMLAPLLADVDKPLGIDPSEYTA